MRKFIVLLCLSVFLFSCHKEKEISFSLIPLEEASAENAMALAEDYVRDTAKLSDAGISTNADGSVSIAVKEGAELLRVYSIADQRIIITPEGYYDDSTNGASLLSVVRGETRYVLDQFFEALYRPDLVLRVARGEKSEKGLVELLGDDKKPPALTNVSITANAEINSSNSVIGNTITASVTISDNGGGAGVLSIFGRSHEGKDELLALYDIDKDNGQIYTIPVPLNREYNSIGVSAFNHDRTVESERIWTEISTIVPPDAAKLALEPKAPSLYALFADGVNPSASLEKLFAEQEQGGLYSKMYIQKPGSSELEHESFSRFMDTFTPDIQGGDVFIINLPAQIDRKGDFIFSDVNTKENSSSLDKWDLLCNLLKIKTGNFLVLLNTNTSPDIEDETAFARLGKWLGGKGLAIIPKTAILPESVSKIPAAMETPRPLQQFFTAHDFLALIRQTADVLVSSPSEDFNLFDPYPGYGTLRMQTMASGTIAIDGFDMRPLTLTFGETLLRRLPGGIYTVTMTFRNGHEETKTVTLKGKGSEWLIFTYVPDLLAGDLRGMMPSFGVFIEELNPSNYNKYDAALLKQMELPAWNQAFLAGEDLYKKGSYERAITEYNKAISLKNDYTGAYASRGNAYRKKGDFDRAIADYTQALKLKNDYAEIYNYRAYLYCQKGDHAAAIADYTQALKFRSNYADAFFNRAYAYGELKDWDKAIADYSQVIKLEPKNAVAFNQRGDAYFYKGDLEKSEADYAAAEKL